MSYIFITGATSGIGKATAELLAQKKYRLILNGRRLQRLEQLQRELSDFSDVVLAPFDISDSEQVDEWFQRNHELSHQVSGLINNAGLARGVSKLQDADWGDWEEMIDTNVKGLLYVTRKLVEALIQNQGHMVNIGSVAGRWSYGGGSVYCATKFAVRALSEAFRVDLLGTNVRVTNIEPGLVETEFSNVRLRDEQKARQVYQGMQPLTAKDIAESIVWSLERPKHVNIQEMVIFPTQQASVKEVHRQL